MREKTDFHAAIQSAFKIAEYTNPFLASDIFISCTPRSQISLGEVYAAGAEDSEDHPAAQT
jgi:hypothetical protein